MHESSNMFTSSSLDGKQTHCCIRMTILESNEEIDVIVNKVVAKLVILLRLHCTERRLFSRFSYAVN